METCDRAPAGWWCSRTPGHDGPCAARPTTWDKAGRDLAVRVWLDECAGRTHWYTRKWWKVSWLRDAYERGYTHGWLDAKEGYER
jgi:hypothetical protein